MFNHRDKGGFFMGRKRGWYQSNRNRMRSGLGAKTGKTLIRQIIVCLIIVLVAIVVKKMDHAMTNRALDTVQTFMEKDYSNMEMIDSAKSVFSHLRGFPETVETAIAEGRRQMNFIEPSNEENLAMTFGGESGYEGLKYSSEEELQVHASSGGTVLSVEGEAGNQRVRISHGGEVETQYAGCSNVYVKPLEKVRKGQLIASVAPGEQSCLTFSLWKGSESVNPADYIEF